MRSSKIGHSYNTHFHLYNVKIMPIKLNAIIIFINRHIVFANPTHPYVNIPCLYKIHCSLKDNKEYNFVIYCQSDFPSRQLLTLRNSGNLASLKREEYNTK